MSKKHLRALLENYKNAPPIFQATSYWSAYEKEILNIAENIDFDQIRSGKYHKLATFGFTERVYNRKFRTWKKLLLKILKIKERHRIPYSLTTPDIEEMAFHYCELVGNSCHAKAINEISTSSFGNPASLFHIDNQQYTVTFLNYYLRYCFANKHINFNGREILVELGSGSGYLIEVLKKLYPDLTILCFDLPTQLYLCEKYLTGALGSESIVSSEETLNWTDLSLVKKGKVHFLPNWLMPLLKDYKFDIFWNSASFGEMEPAVVENYLSCIKGQAQWVYLQ
jgi:putative sugar O-methyltransferase